MALAENQEAGAELGVIYGHCHPEIMDILQQYKARKIQRIIVLDSGIIPINEEKVERFSQFTNLPFQRKLCTLDNFLNLIENI